MHIAVNEIVDGQLRELRISSELYERARVPLEHLPSAERAWLTKLALAAQRGDARSTALLLEAVQGVLLVDDTAQGLRKRGGDSPA